MLLWAGLGVLLLVAAVGVIVVVRHDERRELPPAPVPTPPPPPANLTPRPVTRPLPTPPPSAAPNPTPPPHAAAPAPAIPTPPPQPAFVAPPPPPEPMPTPPPRVAPSPKISAADLAEVQRLNSLGRPISALKLYREKTDATLAEAKAVLAGLAYIEQPHEAIVADLPPPPKTQSGHMPAMPVAEPPAAAPPPPTAPPSAASPGAPATSAPNPTPAPRYVPEPPPPPEEMTDEDDEEVRALIQWDRIDDAIKLYRHIHDVDLPTAQAAVKRLTRH